MKWGPESQRPGERLGARSGAERLHGERPPGGCGPEGGTSPRGTGGRCRSGPGSGTGGAAVPGGEGRWCPQTVVCRPLLGLRQQWLPSPPSQKTRESASSQRPRASVCSTETVGPRPPPSCSHPGKGPLRPRPSRVPRPQRIWKKGSHHRRPFGELNSDRVLSGNTALGARAQRGPREQEGVRPRPASRWTWGQEASCDSLSMRPLRESGRGWGRGRSSCTGTCEVLGTGPESPGQALGGLAALPAEVAVSGSRTAHRGPRGCWARGRGGRCGGDGGVRRPTQSQSHR